MKRTLSSYAVNGLSVILLMASTAMAGVVNVAAHKPVAVHFAGSPPLNAKNALASNVVDGDSRTWLTIDGKAVGYDNTGTSVVVSLNDVYAVQRFHVLQPFDQLNKSLRLQGYQFWTSTDSVVWTKVIDMPENSVPSPDTALAAAVNARFIKLVVTAVDAGTQQSVFAELEVYADVVSGIAAGSGPAPDAFSLSQNYPNPFNPSTLISYAVKEQCAVSLTVFDLIGRTVATLVEDVQSPGYYTATFDAAQLSSGIYFCKLSAGSFVSVKKMILQR